MREAFVFALATVFLVAAVPSQAFGQDWGLTRSRDRGASSDRLGRDRGRVRSKGRSAAPRSRARRSGTSKGRRGPKSTGTPEGAGAPQDAGVSVATSGDSSAPASVEGGREAGLIRRYRAVLENDPRETFAFTRLVELYRERDGNVERLTQTLEAESAGSEQAYVPRMLLGHLLKARGDIEGALERYRQAVALRPAEAAPELALGNLMLAKGDGRAARAHLERALGLIRGDEERRELTRKLGEVALGESDFEAARKFFDELSRSSRGNLYLRTEFARALAERGYHQRAVAEYDRLLGELRGDNRVLPPLLRDKGRAELEAGLPDQAIETLDRALRLAGNTSALRGEILDVLVDAYRRGERLEELATKLDTARGRSFANVELLGRIWDELGHEEQALDAYRRALKIDRRHIDTRVRIIQLLSRAGHLDRVIDEYRELVRVAPREPRFVVELARLLMQTGRGEEARKLARDTSRRHRKEPSVHEALAELYTDWGEHELATEEVSALVRVDPRDPAHLVALGEQQLDQGDIELAKATWKRILLVDRDRARAHATIALVMLDHALLEDAEKHYRSAVKLEPNVLDYVRGLATVLERERSDDEASEHEARDLEAVELWAKVIALSGGDRASGREARRRIVGIWARRQKLSEKISEWSGAFEAEPPDLEAGRFLGEAYLRTRPRRLDKAAAVLDAVVARARGDVESLLALERVRTLSGDLAAAIDVLARLVEADPRRASSYYSRMSEHAHALYRDEEAVRYAALAVDRTPGDASAHHRLGELYRARQDVDRAIASYRRAIELNDRLFSAYFDLAALHRSRGELAEADLLYRHVLRTTVDDELVAVAARESLQYHLANESLETLEADLLPLALSHTRRPVFRRLLVELYDAYAAPRIDAVQTSGPTAEQAGEELRRLGSRAIKPLLEALADDSPAQRRVAVELLGVLDNENAVGPLLAAAEGDGALDLRARALFGVGALGGNKLGSRIEALATGPERQLRVVAAWALARVPDASILGSLRTLVAHGDSQVRAFALLGLGAARDNTSRGKVVELLRSDPNAVVRAAACLALARLEADDSAALLIEAVEQGGLVGRAAVGALGALDVPQGKAALVRLLFSSDLAERNAADAALRGDGLLADQLPTPSRPLGAKEYVEWLLESGPTGGQADLRALGQELIEAARDGLAGPLEQVQATLRVLQSSQMHSLIEPLGPRLIALFGHPNASVRAAAAQLSGSLSGPEATRALIGALSDPEATVRRAALDGLGPGHAEALSSVGALASHEPDWATRLRAVRALGRVGGAGSIELLRGVLLTDSYALVRKAAVDALAEIGTAAIDVLERALVDPELKVRSAAIDALEQIDDPRAHQALEGLEP